MNQYEIESSQHLLHILKAPLTLRRELLKGCSKRIIGAFCELSLNVCFGYLALEEEDKNTLQKYKNVLDKIIKPTQSFASKRQLICKLDDELINHLKIILQRYV